MSSSNSIKASFTLGFLGAGQLARMSACQAFRFGIRIATYSDRSEQEPAQFMTPTSRTGSFDDVDALVQFAGLCDALTLENEFIDSRVLEQVSRQSGTPIFPSPQSFAKIENKRVEKQTFEAAGIPVTPYAQVDSAETLEAFGREHGWPFVLKSSKGGYDGYGNEVARNSKQAVDAFKRLGGSKGHEILAEALIDFSHELAVQVARNETGSVVYPCCQTVQINHICVAVKSPAPVPAQVQEQTQELALAATDAIDGKGLFAYEFFLTREGDLLLNESAPRPHNSGHYTIEGTLTSQFENHIRAVLGMPLGDTSLRRPAAATLNLLGSRNRTAQVDGATNVLKTVDAHLHIYGKIQSKPGRKMGHLTVLGEDLEQVYAKASGLADGLRM